MSQRHPLIERPSSLLLTSAAARLAGTVGLTAILWATVAWALAA